MVNLFGRGNNDTHSIKATLCSQPEGEMEVYWVNIRSVNTFHCYFDMVSNFEAICVVFLDTLVVVVADLVVCIFYCVCRYALILVYCSL